MLLAAGMLATAKGFTQNEMALIHQNKAVAKTKAAASQTIQLQKGALFIVISSITKPGAQQLMNDYFQKVFPIASKNGFKPLASLPIDQVVAGDYKPNNFVGLYSWPDMQSAAAFLKELPNSELTPMRKKIWHELKQVMGRVEEDFQFTIYADKIYEVQTIWNASQVKEDLKKYHGKIVFDFPVTGYEDLNNGTQPSQTILIEWRSKKDADMYRKQRNATHREEAFLTHLQLPPKK